jgi:hypothetical protein
MKKEEPPNKSTDIDLSNIDSDCDLIKNDPELAELVARLQAIDPEEAADPAFKADLLSRLQQALKDHFNPSDK